MATLNICSDALTKGIISDCTTQPIGGIEQRVWIFKRGDHTIGFKTGTSNVIETITNAATKKSYKGVAVDGKAILRVGGELNIVENRANTWNHKFNFENFEFAAADILNLDAIEDIFIVAERIDKATDGDGTFFALGVKNGLRKTAGTWMSNENNGVCAIEMVGTSEPVKEYTVMAVPVGGESVYAATLAMLVATETVPV